MFHHRFLPCCFAAALCALISPALAAPTISRLSVRGLQAGGTTSVIIDGADLLPSPRLVCSAPITQTLKAGATAAKVQIDVTVDAKTDPGFYNLWLVTDKGISPVQIFAIDSLPQRPLAKQAGDLPVALYGNYTGSKPVETTFAAKSGDRVMIEVESQRLGSKEQPVIHLIDPAGHEMALALPAAKLRGDARLIATMLADGSYTLRIHDLQYAGGGPFRLKIGQWQFADIAFPPTVERGKPTKITLIDGQGDGQQVECTARAGGVFAAPWADASKSSGMRPMVSISDMPELVEDKSGESPQSITGVKPPFAISGRLMKPGETGAFKLEVEPESSLNFSVVAAKIGSPIDAILEIHNEKGDLLASNDDAPGSFDPQLDFKVPKGVKSLIVGVRDAYGRGSPGSVFRLIVQPGEEKPGERNGKPDFDLHVEENTAAPSAGAYHLLKVIARRRGYDGPIALKLVDAPASVTLQRAEIPAGADAALVAIAAGDGSADAGTAIAHLVGEGKAGDVTLTRKATFELHPLAEMQPWLGDDLLIKPGGTPEVRFTADFSGTEGEVEGVLSQKAKVTVNCSHPAEFDGPVRLTLMTSQIIPLVRNQNTPDPARTLRPEAAKVEIAADTRMQAANDAKAAAEKALAAAEKALASAKTSTPALEQKVKQATDAMDKAKEAVSNAAEARNSSTEVTLLVPNDLAPGAYDVAFKAELLGRNLTTVIATCYTPVVRMKAVTPVLVKLDGEPKVEVQLKAKTGATAVWTGKVERLEGVKGEVALTLENLPKGVLDPKVTIADGKTDFKIELKLPATVDPGETAGIKLFGTLRPAANAAAVIRSSNIELALKVLAIEKEAPKASK